MGVFSRSPRPARVTMSTTATITTIKIRARYRKGGGPTFFLLFRPFGCKGALRLVEGTEGILRRTYSLSMDNHPFLFPILSQSIAGVLIFR